MMSKDAANTSLQTRMDNEKAVMELLGWSASKVAEESVSSIQSALAIYRASQNIQKLQSDTQHATVIRPKLPKVTEPEPILRLQCFRSYFDDEEDDHERKYATHCLSRAQIISPVQSSISTTPNKQHESELTSNNNAPEISILIPHTTVVAPTVSQSNKSEQNEEEQKFDNKLARDVTPPIHVSATPTVVSENNQLPQITTTTIAETQIVSNKSPQITLHVQPISSPVVALPATNSQVDAAAIVSLGSLGSLGRTPGFARVPAVFQNLFSRDCISPTLPLYSLQQQTDKTISATASVQTNEIRNQNSAFSDQTFSLESCQELARQLDVLYQRRNNHDKLLASKTVEGSARELLELSLSRTSTYIQNKLQELDGVASKIESLLETKIMVLDVATADDTDSRAHQLRQSIQNQIDSLRTCLSLLRPTSKFIAKA